MNEPCELQPDTQPKARGWRSKAPVFTIGCGRSGTTLLYHMLLSSGDFAVYRMESNVINLLEPRFGNLGISRNKQRLLEAWFDTRLFTRSGLEKSELTARVMRECQNGGDFLRILMEEMCRKQGVHRWADTTPEHLLFLPRIKETIPDALIVHIIRDGRDVALSTAKQGYIHRLPWDPHPPVMACGIYWEWMVRRGREDGRKFGGDYMEVHFEDLVSNPQPTLRRIGEFIEHDLDYNRICQAGIGSVSQPNSSFQGPSETEFNPMGRWRSAYQPRDLELFEGLVGNTLQDLGYELGAPNNPRAGSASLRMLRANYHAFYDTKLFLKSKTPLGQLLTTRDLSWV